MTRSVFESFRDFRVEPIKFAELDRLTAQLWTFAGERAVKVEWYPDEAAARAQAVPGRQVDP